MKLPFVRVELTRRDDRSISARIATITAQGMTRGDELQRNHQVTSVDIAKQRVNKALAPRVERIEWVDRCR